MKYCSITSSLPTPHHISTNEMKYWQTFGQTFGIRLHNSAQSVSITSTDQKSYHLILSDLLTRKWKHEGTPQHPGLKYPKSRLLWLPKLASPIQPTALNSPKKTSPSSRFSVSLSTDVAWSTRPHYHVAFWTQSKEQRRGWPTLCWCLQMWLYPRSPFLEITPKQRLVRYLFFEVIHLSQMR